MRLLTQILTQNDCFKAGKTIKVQGVMIHSTGANNPYVKRYVPGNDIIGLNKNNNHWDKPGLDKCVHAFIGKFADGKIGTVQTLPFEFRGWHAGGKANNSYIGFEICEDGLTDETYFNEVYREAVEFTALLCFNFCLNPMGNNAIICHNDGYKLGIASNHADINHWFPKFGKDMDLFRKEVKDYMTSEEFKRQMDTYRADLSRQPPSIWGKAEYEEAIKKGVSDGTRPMDLVTRQEVLAMIMRAIGGIK